jgi:hypothetical protein
VETHGVPFAADCSLPNVTELVDCQVANTDGVERVAGWWLAVNADGVELACAPLDRLDDVLRTLGHDPGTVSIERVASAANASFLGGAEIEL